MGSISNACSRFAVIAALLAAPCFAQSGASDVSTEALPPPAERQIVAPRTTSAVAPQPKPQSAPPAAAQPSQQSAAPAAAVADLANGERVFTDNCVICHGADGTGGHGGGAPLDGLADAAAAMRTLDEGRNAMPSFRGALTPEQIRDVATFVVERL